MRGKRAGGKTNPKPVLPWIGKCEENGQWFTSCQAKFRSGFGRFVVVPESAGRAQMRPHLEKGCAISPWYRPDPAGIPVAATLLQGVSFSPTAFLPVEDGLRSAV